MIFQKMTPMISTKITFIATKRICSQEKTWITAENKKKLVA